MNKHISFSIVIVLLIHPGFVISQAPALSDQDNRIYSGFNWGSAGITTTLLRLSQSEFLDTSLKKEIVQAAIKGLEYIWYSRFELDNGTKIPAWSKYPDGEIYPGRKYGAAGIIPVFLEAYKVLQSPIYLEYATQAAQELILEKTNLTEYPSWPYSYSKPRTPIGITITGRNFGSLGIINALMQVYNMTGDSYVLDYSLQAYQWLVSVSRPRIISNQSFNLLPWYNIDGKSSSFQTSLGQGNAGAIGVFLQLGEVLQDNNITEWATQIVKAFQLNQTVDGYWTNTFTNNDFVQRTSLNMGVAGILLALNNYQKKTEQRINIDVTLSKGLDWLRKKIISNSTHFLIPSTSKDNFGWFSVDRGLVGVLKAFRIINPVEYKALLEEGYKWLLGNAFFNTTYDSQQILVMYPSTREEGYTDISYANGLAGVLDELLNTVKDPLTSTRIGNKIKKIIPLLTQTILTLQNDNGSWNRQIIFQIDEKGSNKSNLFLFLIFVSLVLIWYVYKKK